MKDAIEAISNGLKDAIEANSNGLKDMIASMKAIHDDDTNRDAAIIEKAMSLVAAPPPALPATIGFPPVNLFKATEDDGDMDDDDL